LGRLERERILIFLVRRVVHIRETRQRFTVSHFVAWTYSTATTV